MSSIFNYGSGHLTISTVISIASGKIKGVLSEAVIKQVNDSQKAVQQIVDEGRTVYGVNTGFGILANTAISKEDTATLQYKILQSHSVGVGDPIPVEVAKLMLITKVHALAQGFSGVQLSTLERIIWHIENNVIPVVPEKGSVGASGDLAPLAHLFLPLIGLGEVFYNNRQQPTGNVLRHFSLGPIQLGPQRRTCSHQWHSIHFSFCSKSSAAYAQLFGSSRYYRRHEPRSPIRYKSPF